jgi:hypothetical protein
MLAGRRAEGGPYARVLCAALITAIVRTHLYELDTELQRSLPRFAAEALIPDGAHAAAAALTAAIDEVRHTCV